MFDQTAKSFVDSFHQRSFNGFFNERISPISHKKRFFLIDFTSGSLYYVDTLQL